MVRLITVPFIESDIRIKRDGHYGTGCTRSCLSSDRKSLRYFTEDKTLLKVEYITDRSWCIKEYKPKDWHLDLIKCDIQELRERQDELE